ncbi:wax ester/triacylglycerol synthase domain-containing protein [Lentzea sp. E54]|uniref:wax ester/triacylglycerol synthase domain-containing protein n=1 Tax=Lentzea xerophila TaxID=3435883 RepID=UPI003DA566C8
MTDRAIAGSATALIETPRANLWTRAFYGMGQVVTEPSDLYFGFVLRAAGEAPALEDLRRHVAQRMVHVPVLTYRLEADGSGITWVRNENFDIRDHVQAGVLPEPGRSPAQTLLARGASLPLWGMWLVPVADENRWELHYLTHHAVQDAAGAIRTLQILLGDEEPRAIAAASRSGATASVLRALAVAPDLLSTYRPGLVRPSPPAPAGSPRSLAYAQVPTGVLKAIARTRRATVNQVHLGAMAIALDNLDRERTGSPVPRSGRPTYVAVPVDTRVDGEPDGPIGNHLGLIRVPLPSGSPSPATALDSVIRSTHTRRLAQWRRFWHEVSHGRAEWLAARALPRIVDPLRSAFTVSGLNINGQVVWRGEPFHEILPLPWFPLGGSCFTLSASYRGTTTMSVLGHGGPFEPQRLAVLWKEAAFELERALVPGEPHRS